MTPGTDCSLPGRLRFHTGHLADRHRLGGVGARLHLGHLGGARHVPRLAERAGGVVRRRLECPARQHRAHGAGILSAVRTLGQYRSVSGTSPVISTGGNPVISERKPC